MHTNNECLTDRNVKTIDVATIIVTKIIKTAIIVQAIEDLIPFELDSHKLMLFEAQKECKKLLHMKHAELFDYICDPIHHCALLRAKDNDYQCGYQYFQLNKTTSILNHKSLGMHLLSATVNLC